MAANPNTFTFKKVFNAEYQMSHFKEPVYQILTENTLESQLQKGTVIERQYIGNLRVKAMGADGSYQVQALTDTAETLTVDQEYETSFYIKDLDLLQTHLPMKQKYSRAASQALINKIDGDILRVVYLGAGTTLDDGSFSGTSGNGYTITASNVATVFTKAMEKLRLNNVVYNKRFNSSGKLEVPEGMPVAVISPEILTAIELYRGGKDTLLGDETTRNGYSGNMFGFNLFVSNALTWTGTLSMVTQPTDGDTVVIRGVTFTFKTTLGSTAGNVLIGGSADAARANLAGLINTPGTTDSNGVALTEANQRLMDGVVATNSNSADTLTIVAEGTGTVVVSETFTDATDTWTTGKQQLHAIFALSKSCSLIIQKEPSMKIRPSSSARVGDDMIVWAVWGRKVFQDQAGQIVQLAVASSTFTSPDNTPN